MIKQTDYQLCGATDPVALMALVKAKQVEGYIALGGVATIFLPREATTEFYQAMVKMEPESVSFTPLATSNAAGNNGNAVKR